MLCLRFVISYADHVVSSVCLFTVCHVVFVCLCSVMSPQNGRLRLLSPKLLIYIIWKRKKIDAYVSVPSYRLLNLELSLEKNDTRLAEFNAEVSWNICKCKCPTQRFPNISIQITVFIISDSNSIKGQIPLYKTRKNKKW